MSPSHSHEERHSHEEHSHHRSEGHSGPRRFCDVLIVGGTAAGLKAAVQLAKSSQKVLVIDGPGSETADTDPAVADARADARSYGAELLAGTVVSIQPVDGGSQVAIDTGMAIAARRVIEPDQVEALNKELATAGPAASDAHFSPHAEWEQRYSGEGQAWSGNPNGTLVAEVADSGIEPGRALDLGAGEGADAVWLARQGWTVTATEVAQGAIDRGRAAAAEQGVEVEWRLHDASQDPLEPATFDLVSAQYPAMPRDPEGRTIASILNSVASGGMLLVVGHAMADPVPEGERRGSGPASRHGFDAMAYIQPDEVAEAVAADPSRWDVIVHERRQRPGGHIHEGQKGGHHEDVILHARRK